MSGGVDPAELLVAARKTMPSGNYLPVRARSGAIRVLVVAFHHDGPALAALADDLALLQMDHPYVKPILLLNTVDVSPVRNRGFVYETAVIPEVWPTVDDDVGSYPTYLQQRVVEMALVYDPQHTVVATPGVALPRQPFTLSRRPRRTREQ